MFGRQRAGADRIEAARDDADRKRLGPRQTAVEFLQPFLAHVTSNAVTYTVNLEATADWKADEHWTVPLNFTITKLTRFGTFPMSVGGGAAAFIVHPGDGPDWKLRVIATLLIPKAR